MQTINREELQQKIKKGEAFSLVDVLSEEDFEKGHIPSAMNVPLDDQFEQHARTALPDQDELIVVYCASNSCQASPKAAQRLEQLGYTQVIDYSDGKADWKEAGLRLDSGR
jgi:rhodanese-related sulfurtransferase